MIVIIIIIEMIIISLSLSIPHERNYELAARNNHHRHHRHHHHHHHHIKNKIMEMFKAPTLRLKSLNKHIT